MTSKTLARTGRRNAIAVNFIIGVAFCVAYGYIILTVAGCTTQDMSRDTAVAITQTLQDKIK